MLRRLFRRLFPAPPAVPDWTAGWDHRRENAPDGAQDARCRVRARPAPVPCRGWCRASWDV